MKLLFIGHKGGEKIKKLTITNKTLIYLLITILTLLFCLSTASANEIYVNTTGNDTSGTGSADNPYLTIQIGIDNLDPDGTLRLANGEYTGVNNTNITINKNLTIIGESQTDTIINGTNTNWILNIQSGISVTLQNLTLTNGYTTGYGGAIFNHGNLTVTNCTFNQNQALLGGAIHNWNSGKGPTCTVTESTFNQNQATYGGAISNVNVGGGSLMCTVTQATFNQNQATYGGALYNLNIVGSLMCTVTESTFNRNQATCGSIYNENNGGSLTCSLHFNRFFNNTATTSGNAIYNAGGGYVDAENNWWGTNNPNWPQFLYGVTSPTMWVQLTINATPDVLCVGETSTVTANLNYNNLGEDLMVIYGKSIPTVEVLFDVDSLGTLNTYSGIISDGNNATTTFTAGQIPGISTVNATVDNTTVTKSITIQRADVYVATAADGGSDSNNGSSTNPFLTLSKAIEAVRTGGRIHIANGEYKDPLDRGLFIDKNMTIFQDNWITGTGTSVIINADSNGGIFFINPGATVTLQNLTMANGTSFEGCGGAILNQGDLNILNCIFSNNYADYYGGAIYSDGNLAIYNTEFTGNWVPNDYSFYSGGAICNMANMAITNCTFTKNSAGTGGAILSQNDPNNFMVTVKNSVFTENYARYYGGAFYIYDGDYTNNIIQFNQIVGNTASQGNAIYVAYGSLNATLNWWGSNDNPSSQIQGNVDFSPWLFMTINATADTINNTQTSNITVSFNNYSTDGTSSNPLDPANGHIPDGVQVTFSLIGDALGTLTEPLTLVTSNGTASILFTASSAGVQQINATTDNQNVSVNVTILPASYVELTKEFRDLPWGNVISTAYYNDKIYAIVKVHNSGPDSTSSVNVLDLLDGLTWTGNYYVYRTVGSYPNTESAWVLNDPEHPFNGTNWNVGSLSTTIGSERWLAIEVMVNQTGTVSNYAETVNQSTSPYQGYANYTVYLTADITPTNITVDDVRANKGDTVTLKAVLTDYLGNALAGQTVEFWIDGVKVGENSTDSTGSALFNYLISETPGSHNLTVIFSETGFYQGSNATGELYVPTANLYVEITSDNDNPTVGEKFTVTYKLGNYGPDDADNVIIIIPIPEGFHILQIYGDGNWTVNANGTITWTFTNVTVGDPYLHLYGYSSGEGDLLFTASIFSDTYNLNTIGVNSITIHTIPSEANAATTTKTVGMDNTGTPLPGIVLTILMVLGGFAVSRKKQ